MNNLLGMRFYATEKNPLGVVSLAPAPPPWLDEG